MCNRTDTIKLTLNSQSVPALPFYLYLKAGVVPTTRMPRAISHELGQVRQQGKGYS